MKLPTIYSCILAVAFISPWIDTSYATVGGQYSVNVHFVAPLVTAPCQVAQFWTPPNVVCGLCFCMTGSLSRCIPQPGCNPQMFNGTTAATTTPSSNSTAPQDENTTETGANSEGTITPSTEATGVEKPAENPSNGDSTDTSGDAEGKPSKLRGAKPGKSRRRRHSPRFTLH